MRILQICSMFFDNALFRGMFEGMNRHGMDSIVYVPKYFEKKAEENVYIVEKRFSKLKKLLYWGEQKYLLKDIEKRVPLKDIDCIYAHRLLYGGYIALQLYQKYGIPYVVLICNSDIYGFGRNLARFRKHSNDIMLNAQKVLFFSKPYKELVLEKYVDKRNRSVINNKSQVIINGVHRCFFDQPANLGEHAVPLLEGSIKIIYIGWIDSNKNLTTLLKACDLLKVQGFNLGLTVIGKVINKHVFSQAIKRNYVHYKGYLSQHDIIQALRHSDIFVLPSIHESFGMVYAEAMTQGVPVIYSRGQGFDGQYCEGEVGYSVDSRNPYEIARRIIDIVSNYRAISDRCVIHSKRYNWDDIAEWYKKVFEQSVYSRDVSQMSIMHGSSPF